MKTDNSYWSSSLVGYTEFKAFGIANSNGVLNSAQPSSNRYALPVRQAVGNTYPAQLFKTGQTESNSTTPGSDGVVQSGIAWPNPRFVEGSNVESNCVTDNLTGLMWLKNLNAVNNGQKAAWESAIAMTDTLNAGNGYCGYKDWRLPNLNEMLSLLNIGADNFAAWLMSPTNQGGGGLVNVQSDTYWTSSVSASSNPPNSKAWTSSLASPPNVVTSNTPGISSANYFWPVRGGN